MSNLDNYLKLCEDFKYQNQNSDNLFLLNKNQFDELSKKLSEKFDQESTEEIASAIDLYLSAHNEDKLTSNNRSDWNDYEWCVRQSLNALSLYQACKAHGFKQNYISTLWSIYSEFHSLSINTLSNVAPKKRKGRPLKIGPIHSLIDLIADTYEAYSEKKGDHFTEVITLVLTYINHNLDDVDSLIKRSLSKNKINRLNKNSTEI